MDKDGNQPSLTDLMQIQDPLQLRELSSNMSKALVESQKLMADVLGHPPEELANPKDHPLLIGSGNSMVRLGESLAHHPDRLVNANLELVQGYMTLWHDMLTGQKKEAGRDRRFSDPEWSANPMFDFMRQAYDLNTKWLMSLVDQADDLGEHDKRKAKFLTRQTVDAFAPTNFFATNPMALRKMLETGGASVLEGLRQAREDFARGQGKLAISQTDESPFEIGRNVATAPGQVVFRNDLIELIQYSPTTEKVHEIPLLIFPPWINKFYILDLREENSMIRWLVDKGLTVFVVSWRSADEVTKDFTWQDYSEKGIFAAVEEVLEITGAPQTNTVGYCIGGTLLTSTLAYMSKKGDDRIRSATFFASQSDFEIAGDLMVFTDAAAVAEIERIIEDNDGIMPGEIMGETFNWMRPVDLVWRYVVDNYMMGNKPKPFDLLYWNADQTNIPGNTHLTYLRDLYGHNALSRGTFELFGEKVGVSDVTIPVSVQAGRDDHICPFDSVYRTAQRFGGPVRFMLAGSGHIAGVVNHPDSGKYQHWLNDGVELPESIDDWLEGTTELPGSWWPSWWSWLQPLSGKQVAAREAEDVGLGAAPGAYVKARLGDMAEARAHGRTVVPGAPAAKPKRKTKPKVAAEAAPAKTATSDAPSNGAAAKTAKKPAAKKPAAKSAASKKTGKKPAVNTSATSARKPTTKSSKKPAADKAKTSVDSAASKTATPRKKAPAAKAKTSKAKT
ncbi:MAG: class I poly(R)-hydroxyalkanoic acid synthase [Hyphomonadaceae bacterium]|nr:class I poly(R)-hydroxyalkanoic acid synthase [Hyphomonadaceae bacterium]